MCSPVYEFNHAEEIHAKLLKKVGAEGQYNIICSLCIFLISRKPTGNRVLNKSWCGGCSHTRTLKLYPTDLPVKWFYSGCIAGMYTSSWQFQWLKKN